MVIALVDSIMASGGWYRIPKILEITEPRTMKFLPDVKLSEETQN